MRYTVESGDSLWSIAVQYQGSGTQWPKIRDYHNREVVSHGPHGRLIPIRDPNLIFIGQTLLLPPRPREIKRGVGSKFEASQYATPVDLKVKYSIGRDTPPAVWSKIFLEFDIKAELSGDITLEMLSETRHSHNLEIALSNNVPEVKAKLKEFYHPVLSELLAEPSVKFEGGKVLLNSPIANVAKATGNIGSYTIEVAQSGPNQLSGTLAPPTINGTVKSEGRRYKYSADIAFKVDVFMRPKNPTTPEQVTETIKEKNPETPAVYDSEWGKLVAEVGIIVALARVIFLIAERTVFRPMSLMPNPDLFIGPHGVTPQFRQTIDIGSKEA